MATRAHSKLVLGAILLICASVATATDTLVAKVEHIVVVSKEPRRLFDLFTGVLELPVVWPFADYGDFASGGVTLGNVVLEFAKLATPSDLTTASAFYYGFAFEPAHDATAAAKELDLRGILHLPPDRSHEEDGWVTIDLTNLPPYQAHIFICDYVDRKGVASSRSRAAKLLRDAKGGPLQVQETKEIVIGVSSPEQAMYYWARLSEVKNTEGVFKFGTGPSIRLLSSSLGGIHSLVIRVSSLSSARAFLAKKKMLSDTNVVTTEIDSRVLGGLKMSFVEQ